MSSAAFGSDWVRMEHETVLFRDPSNRDRRFIPVLLADCDIPATLRRYKYIDYRDESDAALQALMDVCRAGTEEALAPRVADTVIKAEQQNEREQIQRKKKELSLHASRHE